MNERRAGIGSPRSIPCPRIDYVFSGFHGPTAAGRPVECRVVADEPAEGVWPSDHFGVLAVLQR